MLFEALTDEESKENWEKYGNPDGPTGQCHPIRNLDSCTVADSFDSLVC